jgi:hypothetical protein
MPYLYRDSTIRKTVQSRNRLPVDIEVRPIKITCVSKGRALGTVCRAVLEPIIEGFVDKPTDADRGFGPRDQE